MVGGNTFCEENSSAIVFRVGKQNDTKQWCSIGGRKQVILDWGTHLLWGTLERHRFWGGVSRRTFGHGVRLWGGAKASHAVLGKPHKTTRATFFFWRGKPTNIKEWFWVGGGVVGGARNGWIFGLERRGVLDSSQCLRLKAPHFAIGTPHFVTRTRAQSLLGRGGGSQYRPRFLEIQNAPKFARNGTPLARAKRL